MTIDLRSDTVTRPTPGMLEAMYATSVGDDVFGEDPAVNRLELEVAGIFGMEAGLFCPSGTMTNQIAIKVLTHTPGELICDELAHIYQYEAGGIAFNSGLSVSLLKSDRGILSAEQVLAHINPVDVHKAETQLVCLENTFNRGGGSVYPMETIRDIHAVCQQNNLKFHLDGARIFNAVIASGQDAKEYGTYFDTISVCLSKGLGAPVGSVLAGSLETIRKARRIRKVLGGGMRQAGYLAAAGSYALHHHIDRLKEDHELAKAIAQLLEGRSYVSGIMPVETNIVVFGLTPQLSTEAFLGELNKHDIKAVPFGPQMIRMVTHLDVNREMLNKLDEALKGME